MHSTPTLNSVSEKNKSHFVEVLQFGDFAPTALNVTLANTVDTEVECCQITTKPNLCGLGLVGGRRVVRLEKWRTMLSKNKTFDNDIASVPTELISR